MRPAMIENSNVIYVLNGPNLNLLGLREPDIYGTDTLDTIAGLLSDRARGYGLEIDLRQTNHEGTLIDWLHEAMAGRVKAVLLNAGGYTHTSIALLDAIRSITVPVIEVHLSNPKSREPYRQHSYIGMGAAMTFEGHGTISYLMALDAIAEGKLDEVMKAKAGDSEFGISLPDIKPAEVPSAPEETHTSESEEDAEAATEGSNGAEDKKNSAPLRRV